MRSACAPPDLIARSKREKRAFAVVPGSKDADVAVCQAGQSSPPSGLNAHLRVSNGASAGHKKHGGMFAYEMA